MDRLDLDLEKAETQASDQFERQSTRDSTSSAKDVVDTSISRHPTHVFRWHTQQLQHIETVGASEFSQSTSRAQKQPLPGFGGGKPFPPPIPAERQAYVVDFDGPDDPLHPFNWPLRRK